jgi:hypothetical protein
MSALWLCSSTGDEVINADMVSNIYERDGKVYASLWQRDRHLDVELEVNSLKEVRVMLANKARVL